MRALELIRQMLDETDIYTNSALAQKLCDTEPEAVAEYLHSARVVLMTSVVADVNRSRRSSAAANRAKSVFADAVESGEVEQWRRGFGAVAFAVNEENVQKKVSRMTRRDCLFVSSSFAARERENALMAAVFRAVADRVPDGKEVGEVFTEDELEDLRLRVLGVD